MVVLKAVRTTAIKPVRNTAMEIVAQDRRMQIHARMDAAGNHATDRCNIAMGTVAMTAALDRETWCQTGVAARDRAVTKPIIRVTCQEY